VPPHCPYFATVPDDVVVALELLEVFELVEVLFEVVELLVGVVVVDAEVVVDCARHR